MRNLSDGRVEVVAEGKPDELDAFLAEVAQSMRGNIRTKHQTKLAPTGEFRDFEIRH